MRSLALVLLFLTLSLARRVDARRRHEDGVEGAARRSRDLGPA